MTPKHGEGSTPTDAADDGLITSLLLAAECLSSRLAPADSPKPRATFATTVSAPRPEALSRSSRELDALAELCHRALHLVKGYPAMGDLLASAASILDDGLSIQLLAHTLLSGDARHVPSSQSSALGVSKREVEVLRAAADGESYSKIGRSLGISPRTVETHLQRAYRKLGVRGPLKAVARAVELGLLQPEALDLLRVSSQRGDREGGRLRMLCGEAGGWREAVEQAGMRPLAEFGLLAMLLCGLSARQLEGDGIALQRRGAILELAPSGRVLRSMGEGAIGVARSIVVAPRRAAAGGFTPGHLYAAYDYAPQDGLNRGAVAEFTPEGGYVRSFAGAPHISCRLIGSLSLAFSPEGGLAATSGLLTDGLLLFGRGGAHVSRLARGIMRQVASDPQGRLYFSAENAAGCWVGTISGEVDGGVVAQDVRASHRGIFNSLAVSQDRAYLAREGAPGPTVEEWSLDGTLLRDLPTGIPNPGRLSLGPVGELYIPDHHGQRVLVLHPDGSGQRWLDLRGRLRPWSVAADGDRLWVCGEAL